MRSGAGQKTIEVPISYPLSIPPLGLFSATPLPLPSLPFVLSDRAYLCLCTLWTLVGRVQAEEGKKEIPFYCQQPRNLSQLIQDLGVIFRGKDVQDYTQIFCQKRCLDRINLLLLLHFCFHFQIFMRCSNVDPTGREYINLAWPLAYGGLFPVECSYSVT